jgi:hypothetical protein
MTTTCDDQALEPELTLPAPSPLIPQLNAVIYDTQLLDTVICLSVEPRMSYHPTPRPASGVTSARSPLPISIGSVAGANLAVRTSRGRPSNRASKRSRRVLRFYNAHPSD